MYSGSVLIVKKLSYDGSVFFAVGIKFSCPVSSFNSHGSGVQIEVDGDDGAHLSFCAGPCFLSGILASGLVLEVVSCSVKDLNAITDQGFFHAACCHLSVGDVL